MSGTGPSRFAAIDPNTLPVRSISGTFFRQTGPRYRATDLPSKAESDGRNHREGREPPMYASSTEDASWGELFRHHLDFDLSPFEVRRRMSTLRVHNLPVLDLTDPDLCARLGVREAELTGHDYMTCQAITELVRRAPVRFGGVLQPSAAIRGQQTLVAFPDRLASHVEILAEPIMTPPIRLFGLFELIIDTLPARLRGPLRRLAATIERELRR